MKGQREFLRRLAALILPGGPEPRAHPGVFSRLATPYTFHPKLSFLEALVAVAGCLIRIFGACILFALCGGLAALAWHSVAHPFWRPVVTFLVLVFFLICLACVMIAVSLLERIVLSRR